MTTKSVTMCMSVRGAIRDLSQRRGKKSYFTDDAGNPLSKDQAMQGLMDELAQGHETMPMSKGCRNPCLNSAKCKGFDYGANGGCPGFWKDCDGNHIDEPGAGALA